MSTSISPEVDFSGGVMKDGIHDIPFDEYRALDRYGSSDLRAMRQGPPALVQWRKTHSEDSDAKRLGTACHCAILTPELFRDQFALKPEGMNFATKEGKAWREEHGLKEILTFEEAKAVRGVREAFLSKKEAARSLDHCEGVEQSVLWTCAVSGLRSKGRPDFYTGDAVMDLKVTRHATKPTSLAWRSYSEGWMHQLAHYRAGLRMNDKEIDRGRIVAISPTPPHFVQLLEIKIDALDFLELENERTRKAIAQCDRTGIWEGTPDSWQLVEPPPSALMETFGALDDSGSLELIL